MITMIKSLKSDLRRLSIPSQLDVSSWAAQPVTAALADVLAHFLLTQRSPHTRAAYARDIVEFVEYITSTQTPLQWVSEITERHVLLWKEHLAQKHARFDDSKRRVANASVARKLCTLSSFLDFALKKALIQENPMELVQRPKVRRQSHATVLTSEEMSLILKTAQRRIHEHSFNNAESSAHQNANVSRSNKKQRELLHKLEMEWCILVLLFTVGMRVSELCQLRLSDLTLDGDLLRLTLIAKGARKHAPLIHPETSRVLIRYIENYRAGADAQEPVFMAQRTVQGKILPIHRSSVFRIVRDAAQRAGIQKSFSPHGCRATLATQLHLAEIPVVEIQTLLNHAQVTTTQLYLHRIDETKEAAALKLPWSQARTPE